MPHEIQINLGASYNLTAFRYLAQQDGSSCGWIKQYEFYVSTDGLNWGSPVASRQLRLRRLTQACFGPGASLPPAQQIAFPQTTGQYIRLRAISEIRGNPWTAVAELNVLGTRFRQRAALGAGDGESSDRGGRHERSGHGHSRRRRRQRAERWWD